MAKKNYWLQIFHSAFSSLLSQLLQYWKRSKHSMEKRQIFISHCGPVLNCQLILRNCQKCAIAAENLKYDLFQLCSLMKRQQSEVALDLEGEELASLDLEEEEEAEILLSAESEGDDTRISMLISKACCRKSTFIKALLWKVFFFFCRFRKITKRLRQR